MNITYFSRGLASFVVVSAVACGMPSADDGSQSQADDIRIKPVGTETMSTLILQLPTGTCLPGGNCARPLSVAPSFSLDNAPMQIGAPLRVLPGAHNLTVGPTTASVTLTAGATRTMVVPVAKKVCTPTNASALPDTQFGRLPALRNASCPSAVSVDGIAVGGGAAANVNVQTFSDDACGSLLWNGTPGYACNGLAVGNWTAKSARLQGGACVDIVDRDLNGFCQLYVAGNFAAIGLASNVLAGDTAVVPGTYTFSVESAAGPTTETRVLAEGDVKDLAFSLPLIGTVPARFNTNITFADARELPDAVAPVVASNCERNYSIPANASGTLALAAFKFAECNYHLDAGGRTVALGQAADNNVTLHRVDVDDVAVTREDGSVFTARGTYQIYFGGQKVSGPFNTNTGIDVMDGAYELVVSYNTAEGAKTNRYNLSF